MSSAVRADASLPNTAPVSSGRLWTSRVLTALIALFMLLDAGGKLAHPSAVLQGFVRSGWPADLAVPLGVILLTSTVIYLIPRTAVLGAILLTGYLGGAVATNLRLHNPLFGYTLLPVYFGVLVWLPLWLRDPRIADLIPLRRAK